MYPLVLIKSFWNETSANIIEEILRANGEGFSNSMSISFDSYEIVAHKLTIATKYYNTAVLLFECHDLNLIPTAVKNKIEGSIFYFDSNDLHFLSELPTLVKFVNDNHVGVSTLITRNLNENRLHGLSHCEIKNICKLDINVIDLNAKSDDDEEAVGFAEVLELLKNHIWSSVDISETYKSEENDLNVEEALNEFENLLNKFHQFKHVSQNMCREEVLQNAENLALLFANMLNED